MRRESLPFEGIAVVSSSGDDPVSMRLPGAARAERAQAHLVSSGYFGVMGVTAASGRVLTAEDDRETAAPVAVVSYPFWATRLQSDPSAVGAVAILNGTPFTIVGVAPREFFGERVRQPPDFWVPLIFQPQIQLRPAYRERTDAVAAKFDSQRLAARLVGFFGGLALLLACVGLYGVVTQSVVRRTSEIGVRMALGAQRRDVLWMVLRDVLVLLALGLLVGVPAALASTRAVASQIYGLQSAAPASFAIAIVLLGVIAVVTGLAPARRATRLDPLIALRDE
jgi:hypothetical protein